MLFSGSSITGQVPPCSSKNSRASSARVVEGGADEHGVALGAVGGVEREQLGVLLEARHAPAGEEVEHHPAAALVGEVEGRRRRSCRPRSAGAIWPIKRALRGAARCSSRGWRARRRAARRAPRSTTDATEGGARTGPARRRASPRRLATSVMARPPPRARGGPRPGPAPTPGRWAAAGAGRARRPAPCRGPSRRRPPRATGPSAG